MSSRNAVERNRLRVKRQDPVYLAQQRKRRAAQMQIVRKRRKREGKCHHCEKPRWKVHDCCEQHLIYERERRRK